MTAKGEWPAAAGAVPPSAATVASAAPATGAAPDAAVVTDLHAPDTPTPVAPRASAAAPAAAPSGSALICLLGLGDWNRVPPKLSPASHCSDVARATHWQAASGTGSHGARAATGTGRELLVLLPAALRLGVRPATGPGRAASRSERQVELEVCQGQPDSNC